ncbi:MAG: chemotaxis-specific protein-glutamate methyltransferase CheB [Planctomycetes bacterium]|nr:chemotaxis-specific protein-glutamate methyltransferase CheB [Planctomycetota bacterium]
METIRVLIADDSSTIRMMLRRLLTVDPQIEVIAAADGRLALQQLAANVPDVVVLDIDMPELDGLATLKELRTKHPKLPVIMFSRLTQRGAGETIEAMLLGADECVLKPDSSEGLRDCVRNILLPHIRALAGRESGTLSPRHDDVCSLTPVSREATQPTLAPLTATSSPSRESVGIIAIAASTGGPAALSELLIGIAGRLTVPVVVVQHMPANFTGALAERLANKTRLDVREATDLAPLDSARIWIAPGNHHLVLERTASGIRTRLNQNPPENECRPAADVLFRSVAQAFGPRVLAIVLTGMGQDGLAGCRSVRAQGGRILVQDEVTSAVWGMPGQVAKAGLADAVLPVEQIGREITQLLMKWR